MRHLRALLMLLLVGVALGRLWALPVRVLVTGDMHGWIEAQTADGQTLGGPAEMLAQWKAVDGYAPEKFLLISCGDIATGPAVSTIYKGAPVIAVMNRMGYDLTVVGNHEFDFGLNALRGMQTEAKFPFLAANLTNADGTPAPIVKTTLLNDEQGVKVGIIGLTLPEINTMANTGGLVTQPAAAVVRATAAALKEAGAQTIIVAAHMPLGDLQRLADQVADLNIPLMLGAHSHEFGQMKVGNTWLVNSGQWWQGYSRIDLDFNPQNGRTVVLDTKQAWLQGEKPAADPDVQAEVSRWTRRIQAEYGQSLGYTATGLKRPWAAGNFVVDSWLAVHAADVALCNQGGVRQDIPAGEITKLTLIGLLPFDNALLRIKLTGAQLSAYNPAPESLLYGGVRRQGDTLIDLKNGQPVEAGKTYRVLINTFLYNTSAALKAADPKPEVVDAHWRNPVIAWLEKNPTSKEKPLETLVDAKARVE